MTERAHVGSRKEAISTSFLDMDAGQIEAGCSQEEGPRKGFVMGSRARGVQEILEKCI